MLSFLRFVFQHITCVLTCVFFPSPPPSLFYLFYLYFFEVFSLAAADDTAVASAIVRVVFELGRGSHRRLWVAFESLLLRYTINVVWGPRCGHALAHFPTLLCH